MPKKSPIAADETLQLRYFAAARDLAGSETEVIAFAAGDTVAKLKAVLAARGGRWAFLAKACRYARDDEFLFDCEQLYPGEEVLVLPPAAGGRTRAQLCSAPIEVGAAERLVDLEGVGGIATFVGTTRRWSKGEEVRFLEFEAYEPLALRELEAICAEAIQRFDLLDVQVLHRVGKVELGQIAVAIACAAAHRGAAFDGCRYVIDELKQRAPIWKKETTVAGAVWINATP